MPNEHPDDPERGDRAPDERRDDDRPRRRERNEDDRDRDDWPARRDRDRDRDDFDRDSRRRTRDGDDGRDQTKQVSILGIFSLIQGIGALLGSCIPCIGALALIGGGVGLLLGVIGLVVAKKSGRTGVGFPIAGISVNVLAMLIGGVWVLFIVGLKKGEGDAAPADDGSTITITAVALDEEYDSNEIAADKKYKGKTLEVTGKVQRITRDDKPDKVTVELTGTPDSTVDCHFDRDQQGNLGDVAVGQQVTIRGKCRGKVRSFVTLETCSIAKEPEKKPEPKAGPPLPVTAETLESDYDRNVVSADAKYKGKVLEVTGKVMRIGRNQPGKVTVEMESENGLPIEFDFNTKETQAPLSTISAGDMVVIRGTCRGKDEGLVQLANCSFVKKVNTPADGPALAVKVETLDNDYQDNVVSADTKYKGKLLEVTGVVARVVRNKPDRLTVELGDDDRVMLVCDFLKKDGQTQLAAIKKGDKVVIRGTCRGQGFGIPTLENCTLVKK